MAIDLKNLLKTNGKEKTLLVLHYKIYSRGRKLAYSRKQCYVKETIMMAIDKFCCWY